MKSIAVKRLLTSPSDCWKHQRFPVDVMFFDIWIRAKYGNGGSSFKMKCSTYVLFGKLELLGFLCQNLCMASNCAGHFFIFRKIQHKLHH